MKNSPPKCIYENTASDVEVLHVFSFFIYESLGFHTNEIWGEHGGGQQEIIPLGEEYMSRDRRYRIEFAEKQSLSIKSRNVGLTNHCFKVKKTDKRTLNFPECIIWMYFFEFLFLSCQLNFQFSFRLIHGYYITHTLLKVKVLQRVLHSNAIEEPFLVPQRIIQSKVL